MNRLFTIAGLATGPDGKTKVKYANNLDERLKILKRDGFTNLNFVHTDTPQTKIELCKMMLGLIQYQNDKYYITKEIDRQSRKEAKLARRNTLFTGTAEQLLEAIK